MTTRSVPKQILKQYTLDGAQLAYQRLQAELRQLEKSFPALRNSQPHRVKKRSAKSLKLQSDRMKKIWLERKKQTAKKEATK